MITMLRDNNLIPLNAANFSIDGRKARPIKFLFFILHRRAGAVRSEAKRKFERHAERMK